MARFALMVREDDTSRRLTRLRYATARQAQTPYDLERVIARIHRDLELFYAASHMAAITLLAIESSHV
jgi:hypothetical protein